jgi:predicted pyridoxine 5'-phosphate oxidase superfamily flavin-nucleotide-binding protein
MQELSMGLMDLISSVELCYLGTTSREGVPDVAPLATVAALDASTLIMAVTLHGKSVSNLQENPQAALVVHSHPPRKAQASLSAISLVTGAQIKGRATILTSGDIHTEMGRRTAETLGSEARDTFDATIVLQVDEIHSLVPGSADVTPTD